MKCFLHIGTEKTATTTLQHFLHLNREKLGESGFLFPRSVGLTNNLLLPITAYSKDRRDDLTKINGIYSVKELISFQEKTISNLKKEIKRNKLLKIIFSSEHIQSRLTNLQEIIRLKSILEYIGIDEVYIIVYLRNPIEIASSLFSTSIINGHTITAPPPPTNVYFNNVCNHKNTLLRFEKVFGREHIIPRLFERSDIKKGSVIEDFLDVIGMPLLDDFEIPYNQNTSLSPLGLELLRRINKKIPLFIDNKINPIRSNIVEYFQNHFTDNKYIMPKQLFDEYDIAFQDSNEWVRKNWFPEKQSLFQKTEYKEESIVPVTNVELNHITDMLAEIWIDKLKI